MGEADLDFLKPLSLLFQFFLDLLEVVDLVCDFGATRELLSLLLFKFLYGLCHSFFVEVDQAHMLLEVFKLVVYSLLFDLKAIVVSQLDLCSLGFNLLNQSLKFAINHFKILNSPELHRLEQLIPILNELLCLLATFIHLPHYVLSIFFQDIHYTKIELRSVDTKI